MDKAEGYVVVSAKTLLRDVFGFKKFRPGQREIIDAVACGENVLAIMPTGGGKSLCFQLPALLNDGLTVVISPLIALMHDQVRGLKAVGVAAGAITSGNTDRFKMVRSAILSLNAKLIQPTEPKTISNDPVATPIGCRLCRLFIASSLSILQQIILSKGLRERTSPSSGKNTKTCDISATGSIYFGVNNLAFKQTPVEWAFHLGRS